MENGYGEKEAHQAQASKAFPTVKMETKNRIRPGTFLTSEKGIDGIFRSVGQHCEDKTIFQKLQA